MLQRYEFLREKRKAWHNFLRQTCTLFQKIAYLCRRKHVNQSRYGSKNTHATGSSDDCDAG